MGVAFFKKISKNAHFISKFILIIENRYAKIDVIPLFLRRIKMKKILSLVLALVMVLSVIGTIPVFAAEGELIIYPEYPTVLPRNYDYEVEVSQNGETHAIPVYGTGRIDDSFSGAKLTDRRFCEFAFEGEVTIRIRPRNNMSKYVITPTNRQIDSTYSNGWVEFKITKPQTLVFRMNDDVELDLAIFADAPQTNVPDKNAEDVMYFDAGLNNCEKYTPTDTGVFVIPENIKHVYLAPGALVVSRIGIEHSDLTISGPGAFLDPHTDRAGSEGMMYTRGTETERVKNVTLDGFKLLDSHSFNLTNRYTENLHIKNIKILSNQISTDGISFFGGVENCHIDPLVEDVYISCNDDNFVAGGVSNLTIKNVITNESHALLIVTQNTKNVVLDGATVLRPNSIYKYWGENYYGKKQYHDWPSVTLKNIYAEDMIGGNSIIATLRDLEGDLNVTYENCTFPGKDNGYKSYFWTYNISTLNITFKNCFIAGQPFSNTANVDDYTFWGEGTNTISFGNSFDKAAANVGYHKQMEKTVSHTGDKKVYVGGYEMPNMAVAPFTENGVTYVDADVLSELGYQTNFSDGVFTAKGNDGVVKFTANATKGSIYGTNVKLPHKTAGNNWGVAISLETLKLLGFDASVSNGNVKVTPTNNSVNLLEDTDFDNHVNPFIPNLTMSEYDWFYTNHFNAFKYGKYQLTSKNPYSGKYSLYLKAGVGATETGVAQYVYPDFCKYGAGTYRLEFYAKMGKNLGPENKNFRYGIAGGTWQIGYEGNYASPITQLKTGVLTTEWTKYTYDIVIPSVSSDLYAAFLYIGPDGVANSTTEIDMCIDNISLTYIDTVSSSNLQEKLAAVGEQEGGVFRGWYDSNNKAVTKSTKLSGTQKIFPRFANFGECVDGLVNPNGEIKGISETASYTNGFYTQGAQLKVGEKTRELRFVVSQSSTFKQYLKGEGFTGISYGVLVAKADSLTGPLTLENKGVKEVKLTQAFSQTDKFESYSITVEGVEIDEEIVIRPYVKYKDFSGVVRVLYGEASTASEIGAMFTDDDLSGADVNRYGYSAIYKKYALDAVAKF